MNMTEQEVSEGARDLLLETYGGGPQIFEPTDIDGDRPDLIVFVEYQSPNRQWVVHSVESKSDKRTLTVFDHRQTCLAVSQARKYYGNYRWLAVSEDVYWDLEEYQRRKLLRDCRKTKRRTGLLVVSRTNADIIVKPGYHPGSWIDCYKDEDWLLEELSGALA